MAWRVITRYNPNRSGMEEIAKGRHLKRAVTTIAEGAKVFAESTSPSGFDGYEDQFEVLVEVIPDIPRRKRGVPMPRIAATLINNGQWAVLVEVGSRDETVEEYRILTRTLRWIELQAAIE